MSVISFGVPSDLSIQGNLTVNTLNGLLKGTAGLVSVAAAGVDYATPAQLTSTGVQLDSVIAGLSGLFVANLALTGSNLYITLTGLSGQSSASYATIVNLASTGGQAWNVANNNGINLSGNLAQSGARLNASIDALSGYAAPAGASYLYTTGTQTIIGAKTFMGTTVFTNITVTGTQTIVNTQEFDVASNFITLNATGGARDAGIFISTGFTGGNSTGAVFGFDVPSNRWVFGIQGEQDDMSRLLAVASTGDVQLTSGVLSSFIASSGTQAWNAANNNALNLSGNLSATGQQAWSAANNNAINLSGNLTQTGVQLRAQLIGLSGIAVQTGNMRGYSTAVTTGLDFLAVTFTPAFPGVPAVVPSLMTSGTIGYMTWPSGITSSGYNAMFSATTADFMTLETVATFRA